MTERTADPRAPALLLALGCTWGASFLFIKVIVDEVSPDRGRGGTAVLRDGRGRWIHGRAALAPPLEPALLAKVSVMAVGSNILPFWLISWGEQHIDSGTASVLNSTVPIFTAVFAAVFLAEERFSAGRLIGLVLGFAGILVLTGDDALRITDSDVLGQLAVVGAAVCYGAAAVYSRTLLRDNDPVNLSVLQLMIGAAFAATAVLVLEGKPAYGSMGLDAWGSLLGLGLGRHRHRLRRLPLAHRAHRQRARLAGHVHRPDHRPFPWLGRPRREPRVEHPGRRRADHLRRGHGHARPGPRSGKARGGGGQRRPPGTDAPALTSPATADTLAARRARVRGGGARCAPRCCR